ncbi:MAG: c-type cytochrome [Bdellovibrionales bacterium]|nr:c-type cytochrome [Bdellovibrionales bacterium]
MGYKYLVYLFSFLNFFPVFSYANQNYNNFVTEQAWSDLEELGFWLFADKRLSGNNQISCMSCHVPQLGWTDGLETARGFNNKKLKLRTPTLIGLELQEEFGHKFFWNGRAKNLEDQALMPIQNPEEMNQDMEELLQELTKLRVYRLKFAKAFGDDQISAQRIAKALSAFERTLSSPSLKIPEPPSENAEAVIEFLNSNDPLNYKYDNGYVEVSRGKILFDTHCAQCHQIVTNLSDGNFHDIGLQTQDIGLAQTLDKKNAFEYRTHRFKHKTPTLWGVAQRGGPYMHNGSLKTLRDVLEHYNKGGSFNSPSERKMRLNTLAPAINPLELSNEELDDLEEFITEAFKMEFNAYPLPDFLQEDQNE